MLPDLSRLLPRIGLYFISAAAIGYIAPESAALALVAISLVAGFCWRQLRLASLLVFTGGLVGLAARYSGGRLQQFYSNLQALGILLIVMIGLYIMARGMVARHRSSRF